MRIGPRAAFLAFLRSVVTVVEEVSRLTLEAYQQYCGEWATRGQIVFPTPLSAGGN
jgi:hypothetical protein